MHARPSSQTVESGFVIVGLIVSSVLLIIVLSVSGGLLISATSTSKLVQSTGTAASAGQMVAQSVSNGIRNASDFRVTSPVGNDQLVVARTALGGSTLTWVCAAWYYSATDSSIRYTTSTTAISAVPTATELAVWTLLDSAVAPTTGTRIFNPVGQQLTMSFTSLAGQERAAVITTSVFSRAGSTRNPACY